MERQIIELNNLSKRYGSLTAVDSLSLSIQKGEIFGLLGPNGAGKTTTILMMLGLTEPDAGTAYVCGHNATKDPIAVKQKVGYMPDSIGFYDDMTAWQNLMYIGELNGIAGSQLKQVCEECVQLVGLDAEAMARRTSTFSRGMKQRLGLAEVLIKQPEVIILDEPTLGIDPIGVKEFLDLIVKLSRQKGLTVLLSSHYLQQVQQVCDRVGIFVNGKLQAQGDLSTLARSVNGKAACQVQIVLQQPLTIPWKDEADIRQLPAVQEVTIDGHTVDIALREDITPEIVRFFVHKGYDVAGVQKKEYQLDDIYQSIFSA
ncbi:ABC transporter ATP-binding protein [Marinoscillum furvescens]|uniref:ABC-2 type transport system ATP-binding protein n=1 Tax=Marinoscillum furvescens DSM 4134 TaxID=1122208 RepID=A0A3D9KWL1_MARFU|nr:ABC transporter ATP-binding protein [Marinoscillum furvescens]RED92230.1 ABC-2 type transport system ATP-binding protein [Marinoscillum furvescens DSM 4134]